MKVFETAFESAPMGVAVIGLDGRFQRVNDALCRMLGRTAEQIIGSTSQPFTHPDDLQVTAAAFDHLKSKSTALEVIKRYLRPDGTVVWAETKGTSVWGEDGNPRYVVAHFKDITADRLAEQQRAEATERFELVFSDAPIGMALVGLDGSWLKVNRRLCIATGYSEAELLKRTFQEITHPDDLDSDLEHLQELLAGDIERYSLEKRYITASGDLMWVNLSVSLVRDADAAPHYFVAHIEDITGRKRLEASLHRLADHDPLTDLWNRRRFEDELQRQIGRCRRYGERAALLMIDLNGFKAVNDTHGHRAGDDLLRRVGRAISQRIRSVDAVARIGGDEFAIVLTNITPEQATSLATQLRDAVGAASIDVDGQSIAVTASIGIAFLDDRTHGEQEAMAQADAAMYEAKVGGLTEPVIASVSR